MQRTKLLFELRSNGVLSLHQYTTKPPSAKARRTNTHPLVDFLIKSLGFSKEHAESASEKVIFRFKSLEKPQMVVDFLKETGFGETHIMKLVDSYPRILFCKIEKTLKPKIEAFRGLGLSGSQIGTLFSVHPFVIARGLNTHIMPTIRVLNSVFTSNDNLFEAMKKTPWMLSDSILKNLPKNVALLQSHGLSRESIEKLMLRRPQNLLQDPPWFKSVAERVEKKLGISRDSEMFANGLAAIVMMSEEKVDAKLEIFRNFGWTESNILLMIKTFPFVLNISEGKIVRKLELLMGELGFDPEYVAIRPCLLTYSLEKRMLPRIAAFRVLKEKELIKHEPAFITYMQLTEAKFLEKFLIPFKDDVPCLYDDYCNSVGSAPKI